MRLRLRRAQEARRRRLQPEFLSTEVEHRRTSFSTPSPTSSSYLLSYPRSRQLKIKHKSHSHTYQVRDMAHNALSWICVSLLVLLATPSCLAARSTRAPKTADPTEGFTAVSLDENNFELQRPYDEASGSRYSFDGTVRKLWVLSTDKPHARQSHTSPRTEIRMTGYDYSSGVWQFEGHGYVPSGTSGVSIMQVFGGGETATTLMLHVYNGVLHYYDKQVVEDNIYNRWFKLNVIHDVDASELTVLIDGEEKLHVRGRGGDSHYFKFGVYAQNHDSSFMESRWKDVRILKKD